MSHDQRYVVKKRTTWDEDVDYPRPHGYVVKSNLTIQEARDLVAEDDARRTRILEDPSSKAMDKKQASSCRCYIAKQ